MPMEAPFLKGVGSRDRFRLDHSNSALLRFVEGVSHGYWTRSRRLSIQFVDCQSAREPGCLNPSAYHHVQPALRLVADEFGRCFSRSYNRDVCGKG